MYKKALEDLIQTATAKFFKEHTDYKEVCCFKVTFEKDSTTLSFNASVVACDNDPKWGEYFTVHGWVSFEIEFSRIISIDGKELYNRFN